jgi:hypothetical protein
MFSKHATCPRDQSITVSVLVIGSMPSALNTYVMPKRSGRTVGVGEGQDILQQLALLVVRRNIEGILIPLKVEGSTLVFVQ